MDLVGWLQANCLSLVEPQLNASLLTIDLFEDYKPNLGLLLGPKPYEKFLVSVLPPETKIKTGLSQKISETR